MAESIVFGVVVNLLGYLGKLAVEKIAPYFGGRSKLNELKNTMELIQARLCDAERRGEGEDGAMVKVWLKRLKRVLYRLEDLLEEVTMADEDEEINQTLPPRGKLLLNCTCVSFSRWSSPLIINKLVADEAKAIMEELAGIQLNMVTLNLVSLPPIQKALVTHHESDSRETHSFIVEGEVIGRDDDKRAVLDLMFHSDHNVRENVSVIPIVGIGGLGKTTLAQIIFNDEKVQNHFELKAWACISEVSSLKELVEKILQSIIGESCHQMGVEQLQARLRVAVNDKKYLLVLDDIWDEDRERWLALKRLLCGSKQGSKIIVTSRSKVVAENMGTVHPYELGVLPEDQSWALFRRLAFKEGQEEGDPNLSIIGRDIVKKCGDVPLAIRTIAGLLYSKDTVQEWEYIKDSELRTIKPDTNIIMSTLKLSYDHLPSHLKQCFAYCSLFPKDYEFNEQYLIGLWMAQGFIGSSNGNQSPEVVGHGYFMELVRRSFFQNIERNYDSDAITSCKMHDLVHDLALDVARGETFSIDGPVQQINADILHVSCSGDPSQEVPLSWLAAEQLLRSLIFTSPFYGVKPNIDRAFPNLRHVRALDLYTGDCKSLPNSIRDLKHLRYLRLGGNLESLPEGITRLRNLQTLDIQECYKLGELPRNLSNLISLRHLCIRVSNLMDLPPRFGQLTSLRGLNEFIVGENNRLGALACLKYLTGWLRIRFMEPCGNAASKTEAEFLKEMNLTGLLLTWPEEFGEAAERDPPKQEENELATNLECLQLPPSLKKLTVWNWKGVGFPRWGMDDELRCLLPNLVSVQIYKCRRCEHLPPLSRLPRLRHLSLGGLQALEYMEIGGGISESETASSGNLHFPSLEHLELKHLPKLKSWSRCDQNHSNSSLLWPVFPRLLELDIRECPELRSMPLVPNLGKLEAYEVHGKLVKHLLCGDDQQFAPSHTLRALTIEWVHELDSLSVNPSSLEFLTISGCRDLRNLILGSPTPLRKLEIRGCKRLGDISAALMHGSVLEELSIEGCDLEEFDDEETDYGNQTNIIITSSTSVGSSRTAAAPSVWQSLTSLHSLYLRDIPRLPRGLVCLAALEELTIDKIPNLRALPERVGHLSLLRRLHIWRCPELMALPKSIRYLTALQQLKVVDCPEIKRRCEEPDGEDWPLIRHIPFVDIW